MLGASCSRDEIIDGLSIPFVSFSRKATRSLSISATLASGNSPEWLNSARRAPPSGNTAKRAPTPHHTDTVPATDIEAGPTATVTQGQASEQNATRIFVDAEVCILARYLADLLTNAGICIQEGAAAEASSSLVQTFQPPSVE